MTQKQESLILSLLSMDPNGYEPVEIQKLMFLFTRAEEDVPSYEFFPYLRGGYSSTLRKDMERIAEKGWIRELPMRRWVLTEAGTVEAYSRRATQGRFRDFVTRYPYRRNELISYVYRRYPYWAINSAVKVEVLGGDGKALQAIEDAKPKDHLELASIGYEGRSLENYLNALIRDGITVLCDVRKNPISRKYGFSKTTLEAACKGIDIEYRHYPQLGIPGEERRELNCQADYDQLFDRYERTVLPCQTDVVAELSNLVSTGCGVALTCFEANPAQCHRTRVLSAIEQRTGIEARLI